MSGFEAYFFKQCTSAQYPNFFTFEGAFFTLTFIKKIKLPSLIIQPSVTHPFVHLVYWTLPGNITQAQKLHP